MDLVDRLVEEYVKQTVERLMLDEEFTAFAALDLTRSPHEVV